MSVTYTSSTLRATGLSGVPDVIFFNAAHTIGFDAARNKVNAFLPQTRRAMVFVDA